MTKRTVFRFANLGLVPVALFALVLAACGTNNGASQPSSTTSTINDMEMGGNDAHHGLSDAQDGYKFVLDPSSYTAGQAGSLRFHITNPEGKSQTDFALDQTKLIHVYVIRADVTNYQHLHPQLQDGTFSVPVTFAEPGTYRIYGDFIAKDASNKEHPLTLSSPVVVPGSVTATPLPAATNVATVDGYTVTFTGGAMAGMGHNATATITKDGKPITDLEPYLGVYAHLTAFKADTLAVTHLHPQSAATGTTSSGPSLTFMAEFPVSGDYRMFMQFQTAGQLHTASLTYNVG